MMAVEAEVYLQMAEIESSHWWFVGRRKIISSVLERLPLPSRARILDAGCGTGGNIPVLAKFGHVSAFDANPTACGFAKKNKNCDVREGRLPQEIPFDPGSFDLVTAFDILEHLDDDVASLEALSLKLKAGGWMLSTVPAFPFLWSRHDQRHHHKRRYRRKDLVQAFNTTDFVPVFATYYNFFLFPLIAGMRFASKAIGRGDVPDEALTPLAVNRMLETIFSSERHLVGRCPLPFGVSLLILARKGEN